MAFIHSINGVPAKVRIADEVMPEQLLLGEEIPMTRQERLWCWFTTVLSSVLIGGAVVALAYAWGHLA